MIFSLSIFRMENQDGVAFTGLYILVILQWQVFSYSLVLQLHWRIANPELQLISYLGLCCRLLEVDIIRVSSAVYFHDWWGSYSWCKVIAILLWSNPNSFVYLVATEVFSWGSGANYQLGTGNAHLQKLPCKVDSLHGFVIKLISAAKFHSVAVTSLGEVYTWGYGRGGRLGHPDFDIHRYELMMPHFY